MLAAIAVAVAAFVACAPAALAQDAEPGIPVHDPAVIEADGAYYLFATGRGIAFWSSPNGTEWTREAPVFDAPPEWTRTAVPDFEGRFWAPDIAEHDGTFYLYYSVSSFGENASAIGVATNSTLNPDGPAYEWTDHGIVVESVPGRDMWNAIDPNLIVDEDGTPWLAFGSFWKGLKLVRLSDNLTEPSAEDEWHSIAGRHRYWKLEDRDAGDAMNGAIEAPYIIQKGDYYYLFASWGLCCRGENSTYKVVVGRSEDITGPYLDKEDQPMRLGGGSLVVEGNERWAGVGHNSVLTMDGTDHLVFHGYDGDNDGRSRLWIQEIQWGPFGWPSVDLE